MYYTILNQWKTMDDKYYSSSVDKPNKDIAIGDFHAMFKPMQNDQNVKCFRLTVLDEDGIIIQRDRWDRTIVPEPEPEPEDDILVEVDDELEIK